MEHNNISSTAANVGERRGINSMLIDSHCHLDFPDFAADIDAIVASSMATMPTAAWLAS